MTQPINESCSLLDQLDDLFVGLVLSAYDEFNAAHLAKLAGADAEQIGKHLTNSQELFDQSEQVRTQIRMEVERQLGNCERPVLTVGALFRTNGPASRRPSGSRPAGATRP